VGRVRQQKIHAGHPPDTGFFIATHHPESQVWSLRVPFLSPPTQGSRCAAPFPRILPRFPSAPSGSPKALMRTLNWWGTGGALTDKKRQQSAITGKQA